MSVDKNVEVNVEKIGEVVLQDVVPYILSNIRSQIKMGNKASSKLWIAGAPGMGKSEIILQVCEDHGFGLCVKYMSTMALEQITGLPMKTDSANGKKFINWSAPEIFNFDELDYKPANYDPNTTPTVLFIDDAHQMDKSMQRYLFQLLTYRSVHGHKLPNNVVIILAGNRTDDKAGANQILAPIINRISFITVTSNADAWIKNYAMKNGVRHEIISFIKYNSSALCGTPLHEAWASPRSWTYLSQQLDAWQELNGKLDDDATLNWAIGLVGVEHAKAFFEYCTLFAKWNPEEILQSCRIPQGIENKIDYYSMLSSCTGYVIQKLRDNKHNVGKKEKKMLVNYAEVVTKILKVAREIVPTGLYSICVLGRQEPYWSRRDKNNQLSCGEIIDTMCEYGEIAVELKDVFTAVM